VADIFSTLDFQYRFLSETLQENQVIVQTTRQHTGKFCVLLRSDLV